MQTKNSEKVFLTAKSLLGQKLSGTESELGCAETVNNIFQEALGCPVGGDYSTYDMYQSLQDKSRFELVSAPLAGDVVISPTGYGRSPDMHGHVGIVALYGILSNRSADGCLHEDYNLDSWHEFFVVRGGFPMEFYRVL